MILSDDDGDGVCDDDEVAGCQDPTACNYNAAATDSATCDFLSCWDAPLLRLAILMKQPPKMTGLVCLPMQLVKNARRMEQLCCLTLTVMGFVTKMNPRGA